MNVDLNIIERLISEVLDESEIREELISPAVREDGTAGIFPTMDEAVEASAAAAGELAERGMQDREAYIKAIRETIQNEEVLEKISREAVDETRIGCYEHKRIKNRLAAVKTPGTECLVTEAVTGDNGMMITEYCPFGVIGAITPTTNPTETVINNSISMIAGGNTVVFSPHPRAKGVTAYLVSRLNQALAAAGAPENLITTVAEPSIENTNRMMEHPLVRMLVATGGPSIVHKVLSSGKKAIGAGAGNPPVVVDETADIKKAAADIVAGASFDNNVPCIAEKEVFAVSAIYEDLILEMKAKGAYEVSDPEDIRRLLAMVTKENGGVRVEFVGKSAAYILEKLGLVPASRDIRLIIVRTAADHPFVTEELMMPILPVVQVNDVDEAIDNAKIAEHGNRHTAMIHSRNIETMSKMARILDTTIFVKNAPSYAGIGAGGEGHTTFTIAGPTGEGLTSARSFCRRRRCTVADAFNIR